MQQRDLLKEQIEQLGKVIAKMLADFLGLKSKGLEFEGIKVANDALQSNLELDTDKLVTMDLADLQQHLEKQQCEWQHFEALAKYLYAFAETQAKVHPDEAVSALKRCIELLGIANEKSDQISLDRYQLIESAKSLLNTI